MPRVLNKHKDEIPADAVYIGRGSEWGNPFTVKDFGRGRAIELYQESLASLCKISPGYIERVKSELKGKDLVCFCAPLSCHGDLLLELANS